MKEQQNPVTTSDLQPMDKKHYEGLQMIVVELKSEGLMLMTSNGGESPNSDPEKKKEWGNY